MRKIILILIGFTLSIFMFGGLVRAPPPPALPNGQSNGAAIPLNTNANVNVNGFMSITLLNAPVDFGEMNPGEVNKYDVGYTGPLTVRIEPATNVAVNIFTRANDAVFRSENNSFLVDYMQWAINPGFIPTHNYQMVDNLVTTGTAGNDYPIYHRMHVPIAQPSGFYTVGITITAVQSSGG